MCVCARIRTYAGVGGRVFVCCGGEGWRGGGGGGGVCLFNFKRHYNISTVKFQDL